MTTTSPAAAPSADERPTTWTVPSVHSAAGLVVIGTLASLVLGWALLGPTRGAGDDPSSMLAEAEALLVDALATDDTGTYAEADRLFAEVLAARPDDALALRGAAIVDLGLHRFADARVKASAALEQNPVDHVAMAALVDANIELGHYDAAEVELDRLLAVRPGVPAYTRLSYLQQLRGNDAAAIESMYVARTSAAGLAAETAKIDGFFGELFLERGRLADAADAYRRASEGAPGSIDYRVGTARVAFADGRVDAAAAALPDLLAADPENTAALMLQAEVATAQGRLEDATVAASAVVDAAAAELAAGYGVDPSQALFESTFADPDAALVLALAIHEARPDNVKADHALAWAYHRTGRSEEAADHIADAVRFDTSDHLLHAHAAEIFTAVGDSTAAANHQRRAAQLAPR